MKLERGGGVCRGKRGEVSKGYGEGEQRCQRCLLPGDMIESFHLPAFSRQGAIVDSV